MKRKENPSRQTQREKFTETITVQAKDCEEFVLIPVNLLATLLGEIDELRARVGLSPRRSALSPSLVADKESTP